MASVRAASLSRVSLLDVGIINAYVLWMMANRPLPANQRLFGLKQFKLKLVHDLCDGHISRVLRMPAAVDNLVIERVIIDDIVVGRESADCVHATGAERTEVAR